MLRVAALQLRTSGGDQLARAAVLVAQAAAAGARLVCLPEAFTGPYGAAHFAEHAEEWKAAGSGTQLLSRCAEEHGIYLVGGVVERHPINGRMHNTIAAFAPGGQEVARYRKMHLSRVTVGPDATSEGDVLEAGASLSFFDIPEGSEDGRGWRVGLLNCFDLRFREVHAMLSAAPPHGVGAELVLYPSCWLRSTGRMGHWETLLRARALDGQHFVMGINVAQDTAQDTVAFGRSMVVGPVGEALAVCADDAADEVVLADLEMPALLEARQMIPLQAARRPLVYEDALREVQSSPVAMMRPPPGWRDESSPSRS